MPHSIDIQLILKIDQIFDYLKSSCIDYKSIDLKVCTYFLAKNYHFMKLNFDVLQKFFRRRSVLKEEKGIFSTVLILKNTEVK